VGFNTILLISWLRILNAFLAYTVYNNSGSYIDQTSDFWSSTTATVDYTSIFCVVRFSDFIWRANNWNRSHLGHIWFGHL